MGRPIKEKRNQKEKVTTVYLDKRALNDEPPEEEVVEKKSPAYIIGLTIGVLVGIPVAFMLLWNWLMPAIFGLPTIGFFKSIGLLAMSFILFRR
jgi:hypothetical protein